MRTSVLFAAICLYTSSVLAQQCPTPGPTNWCSGLYQYDGMGNIKFIGADAYTYDALGRLATGTADVQRSGVPSRQTYTYDPFGNRTDVSRDFGSVGCVGGCEIALIVSQITNHITSNGAHYDEAGNLNFVQATTGNTTYPATYTYDGAGSLVRAVASDDRQFIYTADDERIATKNGVTWTWTVRDLDNKVLREYTTMETNGLPTPNLQWAKDYVFRDGGLLLASAAPLTPGSGSIVVQHYHLDHLGTPRVVTSAAGSVIGIHAYYPFGAELDLTPKESNTELLKFTGHERDILPGGPLSLDNMHARYEMATLGRFLSLDRAGTALSAPQTWNRYIYARNSPLRFSDPDGNVEVDIYIRHFISTPTVRLLHGLNRGDDRTFSLKPDASFRTQQHIRVETDRSINESGKVSVGKPETGLSENITFHKTGRASGRSMHADVFREGDGSVFITTQQNESEPLKVSGGLTAIAGISSEVNISISSDGKQIDVIGMRSSYPSMEINATVGSETFAIYRGSESKLPLGFGILGTSFFRIQCNSYNDHYRCH